MKCSHRVVPVAVACIAVFGVLTLQYGCACCPPSTEGSSDVATSGDGYVSLFGGRNLDGWVVENGAEFEARDGLLVVNRGMGWLRSAKEYGDFVLELDFRFLEEGANSGIFVRTAATSQENDNGWPDNGYQVQCLDTLSGDHPIATMIPYGAPPFQHTSDREAIAAVYHPAGEWNSYEIECIGERMGVKLNGTLVTQCTEIKNLRGHVGIQAEHGLLEFRKIRLRSLE